ncbi:phosphoribosyl-AMP cyclohydrolase [Nanoarchaeota archaeon]
MVKINYDKLNGLIPAVIQDIDTDEVLMLGFMNQEALDKTLESGKTWFYSRSKQRLWQKGEQSGNTQEVKEILVDCDEDTVLVKVKQKGPGCCHEGYKSCFFRKLENGELKTIAEKTYKPEEVYKND